MKTETLVRIAEAWDQMTYKVLDLKKIDAKMIETLLKNTNRVLIPWHNEKLVPKEIIKILLNIDEFLYFASMMDEKEIGIHFYEFCRISDIASILKADFFNEKRPDGSSDLQRYDDICNIHT